MASYPTGLVGYASVADVKRLFVNISSFSSLTDDQISADIADTVAEIDATIAPFYTVPVSGDTPALNLLRVINARLAGAEAYRRLLIAGNEQLPEAEAWREYAELLLSDIKSGDIQFFSAPTAAAHPIYPASAALTFESVHDMSADPSQGPIFHRIGRSSVSGDVM